MSIDTPEELEGLKRAGALVAETIQLLSDAAKPGITTGELDALAGALFAERGARSGPILTYRYPGEVCLSVDDEIVHGIPGGRTLAEGELLTVDVALELDGYHADAAHTIAIGEPAARDKRLLDATRAALRSGIRAAKAGATLRDVGEAIQRVVQTRGFEVVPELTGHGIGRAMHEPPTVFNFPTEEGEDEVLRAGMVFTIEPMVVAGSTSTYTAADGWTICTADGSQSAHEEHTIVVQDGDAIVLTAAA